MKLKLNKEKLIIINLKVTSKEIWTLTIKNHVFLRYTCLPISAYPYISLHYFHFSLVKKKRNFFFETKILLFVLVEKVKLDLAGY